MNKDIIIFAVMIFYLAVPSGLLAASPEDVPPSYIQLYRYLEKIMEDQPDRAPSSSEPDDSFRPVHALELLAANCNRGPALLLPQSLTTVRLTLDRFKSMGVQCVKFALNYPMLRPDFPQASEYLNFYKEVVKEARQREIKVMPHITVMFADTPFSPFKDLYQGLKLERFRNEYREMVHLVLRELEPDYLNLLSEPDTHARLTGLDEMNRPQTIVDIVQFALKDLNRGRTLIGAGSGSWSPPDFAETLAKNTDLDYITIHIYPINGPMLPNARNMARVAHAHGKKAVIDESWLYKVMRPDTGDNIAATAGVFRKDLYSFWQPLDIQFMRMVFQLAEQEKISLVSFFWSNLLFSYLDYSPELENLSYHEITRRHNGLVYRNMMQGDLSSVGEFFQETVKKK